MLVVGVAVSYLKMEGNGYCWEEVLLKFTLGLSFDLRASAHINKPERAQK